jgi:hypothetical protein
MKFSQCKHLFFPRDFGCESGIERFNNGVLHISVLTRMSNVTNLAGFLPELYAREN